MASVLSLPLSLRREASLLSGDGLVSRVSMAEEEESRGGGEGERERVGEVGLDECCMAVEKRKFLPS